MGFLLSQADISLHCPVTLTGAVAYVLHMHAPDDVRHGYLYDLIRTDGRPRPAAPGRPSSMAAAT